MADLATDLAAEVALAGQWFDHLRQHSRTRLGVTRASYGEGEQMAHDLMRRIGRDLGLEERIDAAGNLYLTLPGRDRSRPAIMTGSHLDSVPEGGNYDGAAGVVAGMAMLARWRRSGRQPRQDITVMGVRAEELSWFSAPYIGSRAAFGLLEPEALDRCRRPDTGRTLAQHMAEAGFEPERIRARQPQLEASAIRCFLELHIEQGPLLMQKGLPVGIVTGIRGNLRYRDCHVSGRYGHAGAEPRESRRDAVFAGAEFAHRLEQLWSEEETAGRDLVATVGRFHTDTDVHTMTKIPGEVWFTMDIRSEDNAVLLEIDRRLRAIAIAIGTRRGVSIDLGAFTNALPGPIDPDLRRRLEALARGLSIPAMPIASGAGHDAAVFGNCGVPTAMIFVRNDHGSHNPHEAMDLVDFALGLKLLVAAVEDLDGTAAA
ncbi:N-carbamoyl-L-amino-acid hydrolase [Enhydrobacter aerosaccus]|uniref:N-carbamoyl-L-amino-acid hydrolase n=1 Tax=Enhydrobacter aerosaccus TaxID=225324 RepID=A0A1T4K577_9HYPH|nr:Zn-dependent hydrolase [Enhydrobacter aerosaccus]SJZ37487.1 N-carbamoyl-L-amino-acid hydrolase [Enhydrobacter aerosaccus]